MKTTQFLKLCGLFAAAPIAFAQTTILQDTDMALELAGDGPWVAGANGFGPNFSPYNGFFTLEPAGLVATSGDSLVFTSWNDEDGDPPPATLSDILQTFVFQEWGATPATTTTFEPGDVIVFKGNASGTTTGSVTEIRAFVKTLGFVNNLAFQTIGEYSSFYDITGTAGDFELSITYPDVETADPFQVIQMGFEIETRFTTVMGEGKITFKNLEGYIEGGAPATFQGYPIVDGNWIDTGSYMGWLWIEFAPWIYSASLDSWIYLPASASLEDAGAWIFISQ